MTPFAALHASHAGVWIAAPDGTVSAVSRGEAVARAADTPHIVLNAPLTGQRLGYAELSGPDVLELFAFVHPARFAVPTPEGLARALGIMPPADDIGAARTLLACAAKLLATLSAPDYAEREGAWDSAQALARARWPWANAVVAAVPKPARPERWLFSRLPEWEEEPPRPAPRAVPADPRAALTMLDTLTGADAEERSDQRLYTETAAQVFRPRDVVGQPHMLLAEAGTGIGKTFGYLAPAADWVRRSGGSVIVSTFTKALQRQMAAETRHIYPDAAQHRTRVAVRKGRENYLCLLNLEDALQGGFSGRAAHLAHLVARWAAYTRDGDMVGGDLPGWLGALFRRNGSTALTDRRGECIYAGCPHYRKCFIERSARAATQADIVISNHAMMMVQAARPRDAGSLPTRLIFDEGHHLFDTADAMFATALTGQEAIEIRRWILGPEGRGRGRRRGLAARLADVASYDEEGSDAIAAASDAASALPGDGWLARLTEGAPFGPIEHLLSAVRSTVLARDTGASADAGYGLETELAEPDGALVSAAADAAMAIDALLLPLAKLARRLEAVLEDAPDWMDGPARARVEGARHSLSHRCDTLAAWGMLLARVGGPADPQFVDWLALDRAEGREYDCGIHRHYLDPMKAVADIVFKPAHGVIVTSATLRAGGSWDDADARTGARHMEREPERIALPSPFDYAAHAEVLIVTDIARGDTAALAGAYSRLIEAAGGGTLGLFSAIRRLRIVHARIADRLARAGLPLYAQHVDPLDTGTLVDMFRDHPHASLFGTDALRDGVDVPGDSLRLVVMESVPWPRSTVLHAARKLASGGSAFDDRIIRGRLAQGFGRLIRRADDRGQFVILSPSVPSRLLSAFPPDVPIRRLTLDEAIARVAAMTALRNRNGASGGKDALAERDVSGKDGPLSLAQDK